MSVPTSVPDRPRRHPHAAFRAVGNEGGLVVLPGRAEVKVLNPVGIKIFSLLDGNRTAGEIADAVQNEYEIERTVLLKDIEDFLRDLRDHGMLLDPTSGEPR